MSKRIVAIFTGNRAEYGLQLPVLRAIAAHPDLDYRLIVSGAHLDPDFGRTLQEIEDDGFTVHAEVKMDLDEDTLFATAKAIGTGVVATSVVLDRIRPDILVVYADRYEGFAAVVAGTQMGIPTAHIEGGDVTEGGALDDSVRHAMTKLSHLHFTTNQQATDRILAMGEESWRARTVGFPAIDLIADGNFAEPRELADKYGIALGEAIVLFTQHSVATEFDQADQQIAASIAALKSLAAEGVRIIATYPNNDAGGRRIVAALKDLADENIAGISVHQSLGRYDYHGVLALARDSNNKIVCVGNSSSGIKEAPAFACPSVNIGSRQKGRLRAENVIDTGYDRDEIVAAIRKCFEDRNFRERCRNCVNPYGEGNAGIRIAETLAQVVLGPNLIRKRMTI